MKTPKILLSASRQYKHNTGEDGFVFGFDNDETIKIFNKLQAENDRLRKEKAEYNISACYFPKCSELELTWENIETGERADISVKVTKEQGEMVSNIVPPCVYFTALSTTEEE